MSRVVDLPDRFWAKVDKAGECWEWMAYRNHKGYGYFSFEGKVQSAHRLSFKAHHGEIPEGREIDHICRNRQCVRPSHLRAVTHRENILYSVAPLRKSCAKGHSLEGDNAFFYLTKSGYETRDCRICRAAYKRRRVTCGTCGTEMNKHSLTRHQQKMHVEEGGAQ